MAVTRDFIPDGEDLTEVEKRRLATARAMSAGGIRRDFIPAEGFEAKPGATREQRGDEAIAVAMKRQETALADEFALAKERLASMNVGEALRFVSGLPVGVRDMYLIAEAESGGRKTILQHFPEVDPAVVQRFVPATKTPMGTGTAIITPKGVEE